MPNVDDHGLEVLKKAARNIDIVPKKDYALQVIPVGDESYKTPFTPQIINFPIPNADTEVEISLPSDWKSFILRPRKNSRLKLSFESGGTNADYVSIPLGGYWKQEKKLISNSLYVQSNKDSNLIEIVIYK